MSSWPSYTYIEDLTDRINLRSKVLGGAVVDLLPYPSRTNYQKISLVNNIHRAIRQIVGGTGAPGSPFYGAYGGLIIDQNYDGTPNAYDGALITALDSFTPLDWAYVKTTALGGQEWEMKYHREVVDNSSTVEAYRGVAIANGQRAYRQSDRQIVDRVAGAWVANTTVSHADYVTAYDEMIGGDFFTQKIFDQIEAVLALLTTVGRTASWDGGTTANDISVGGSDPVLATSQSNAEAAYALATAGDSASAPWAYNENTQNSGPGDFNSFLARRFNFPTIGFLSGLTTKTVTFYGIGNGDVVGASNKTFDAFGDPVLDNQLKNCSTGTGLAAATTVTGSQMGSLARPSPTWAGTPDPTHDFSRGYVITDILAAIKYDF